MNTRVGSRLAAILSALIIVGIVPGIASASATTSTQVLNIDLTGLPVAGPCWSDQLTITRGSLKLVLHDTTDGSGNVHATADFTYSGVQAVSDSGAAYVVLSETHQTYVVNYNSTIYEINLLTTMRWVSQGSSPNYWTSAWIHTTRTPNGEYAVDEFRFDALCP